jgi:chromosome segregation ATPase
LKQRSDVQSQSSIKLVSRQDLIVQIDKAVDFFGLAKREVKDHLPSIKSYLTETLGELNRRYESIVNRLVKLSELRTLANEFLSLSAHEQETEVQLQLLENQKDERSQQIKAKEKEIKDYRQTLNEKRTLLLEREQKRKSFLDLTTNRERQKNARERIEELKTSIPSTQQELAQIKEQLSSTVALRQKHAEIDARTSDVAQQEQKIIVLQGYVANWNQFDAQIHATQAQLEELKREIAQRDLTLAAADEEHISNERSLAAAQVRFEQLTKSTDTIKQAVSVIAANTDPTADTCPVCNSTFTPPGLIERMQTALLVIGQDVQAATDALYVAKETFDGSLRHLTTVRRDKAILMIRFSELEERAKSLMASLSNIKSYFAVSTDADSASQEINALLEAKNQAVAILNAERNALPNAPLNSDVVMLENSFKAIDSKIEQALLAKRELEKLLEALIIEEASLLSSLGTSTDLSSIQAHIDTTESDIKNIDKILNDRGQELERLRELLRNVEVSTASQQQIKQGQSTRRNEIMNSWKLTELPDIPSSIVLENAIAKCSADLNTLNTQIKDLDVIHGELDRWKGYDEYSQIEKSIKEVIGNQTEEEFQEALLSDYKAKQERSQRAREKLSVLDSF